MKKQHFISIVILYFIAVFYLAITTPISPHEADIYYNSSYIVSTLMHLGENLIGGFLGLRIFFIFFGFISIYFFYILTKNYFVEKRDQYLATAIFMLLPGILTASTLSNISIIVLDLVLLFVILYKSDKKIFLPIIMFGLFFIHEASIVFFIALFFYSIFKKEKQLLIISLSFILSFIFLSKGIEINGRPTGHFMEIFGLYATIFSPFLFLFFFYSIYRMLLREEKDLIWFISFTAFSFSIFLSLRQKVYITDFAPYVMIFIIPMLQIFNNSLRVRLSEFQLFYKIFFYIVMIFLVLNFCIVVFHQLLYNHAKDKHKHFANRIYAPYYLSKVLKAKGITCYDGAEGREVYQLQYYNILPCTK